MVRQLAVFSIVSVVFVSCGSTTNTDDAATLNFSCTPLEGIAPLLTRCSISALSKNNSAVQCGIDFDGDGTQDTQIDNCVQGGTVEQTFDEGSFVIKAFATAASGAEVSASVTLKVSGAKVNRAPVINDLQASVASGFAPLQTSIKFNVSDEDNDALQCALDVNSDGTFEYGPTDCAQAVEIKHEYSAAGAYNATVKVTDTQGGETRKSLMVVAKSREGGDARVVRVEWGQSIISDSLRLVANKDALMRVIVLADSNKFSNLKVQAEIFHDQTSAGVIALDGPGVTPMNETPSVLANSFRATLPAAMIKTGLSVKISVDPNDVFGESDEANNITTVTPSVGKENKVYVSAVPIVVGGVTPNVLNFSQELMRHWPISSVDVVTRAPFTYGGQVTANGTGWSEVLSALFNTRRTDRANRYYFGFMKISGRSGVLGLGMLGGPVAVGRDNSLGTVVHEMGHNFGRQHAPCQTQDADPKYPYSQGLIGSWGYDFIRKTLMPPTSSFDLMSYCDPVWVSDYNYSAVQYYLESQRPLTNVSPASSSADMVLVTGTFDGVKAKFSPVHRFRGVVESFEKNDYVLRITKPGGSFSVPVETATVADGGELHFSAAIPNVDEIVAIELLKQNEVLGQKLATRRDLKTTDLPFSIFEQPEMLTLKWNALVYEEARVTHVSVSGERTTLGVALRGGQANVVLTGVEPKGHFEVSLSSGLNADLFVVER